MPKKKLSDSWDEEGQKSKDGLFGKVNTTLYLFNICDLNERLKCIRALICDFNIRRAPFPLFYCPSLFFEFFKKPSFGFGIAFFSDFFPLPTTYSNRIIYESTFLKLEDVLFLGYPSAFIWKYRKGMDKFIWRSIWSARMVLDFLKNCLHMLSWQAFSSIRYLWCIPHLPTA